MNKMAEQKNENLKNHHKHISKHHYLASFNPGSQIEKTKKLMITIEYKNVHNTEHLSIFSNLKQEKYTKFLDSLLKIPSKSGHFL